MHIAVTAASLAGILLMAVTPCIGAAQTPHHGSGTSVDIDDYVLAGHESQGLLPETSRYEVIKENGKYIVVVTYWNDYQEKRLIGSRVSLDANNQFQPSGMRWKFTLTKDGLLLWDEVPKK